MRGSGIAALAGMICLLATASPAEQDHSKEERAKIHDACNALHLWAVKTAIPDTRVVRAESAISVSGGGEAYTDSARSQLAEIAQTALGKKGPDKVYALSYLSGELRCALERETRAVIVTESATVVFSEAGRKVAEMELWISAAVRGGAFKIFKIEIPPAR